MVRIGDKKKRTGHCAVQALKTGRYQSRNLMNTVVSIINRYWTPCPIIRHAVERKMPLATSGDVVVVAHDCVPSYAATQTRAFTVLPIRWEATSIAGTGATQVGGSRAELLWSTCITPFRNKKRKACQPSAKGGLMNDKLYAVLAILLRPNCCAVSSSSKLYICIPGTSMHGLEFSPARFMASMGDFDVGWKAVLQRSAIVCGPRPLEAFLSTPSMPERMRTGQDLSKVARNRWLRGSDQCNELLDTSLIR